MGHWNKKVAKKRGEGWRKSLIAGRFDAQRNPTKIRELRCKRNMRQQDVAEKMGMSYATYGAVENARRQTREDVVSDILKLFKIPEKKKNSYFKKISERKYVAR